MDDLKSIIIALDQGTTSSRAVAFDQDGMLIGIAQKEFKQHYPNPGWVEHDAMEIWNTQLEVFEQLLSNHKIDIKSIL